MIWTAGHTVRSKKDRAEDMDAELETILNGRKIAVIAFNLGGPDRPDAVRPFLFNLFADPLILRVPGLVRLPLAWFLAKRRAKEAAVIYDSLGGGSPLLENTQAQAAALQATLGPEDRIKVFVGMRYWHPMADEVVRQVQEWGADEVLLLPLYPQFSTTTVQSFRRVWDIAAKAAGLTSATRMLCCYPTEEGFIGAYADVVRQAYDRVVAATGTPPRILFSAHGLPETVVKAGDPYQWQCEETAKAIVARLGIDGLDWVNCYQSRVGPLKWIGPSTDEEIDRAGADRASLVVAPIAFVSDHSETLVEIEIEYREQAHARGVPMFERVPAVGVHPSFIGGLAGLVKRTLAGSQRLCSQTGGRLCPTPWKDCPFEQAMKDAA